MIVIGGGEGVKMIGEPCVMTEIVNYGRLNAYGL